MNEYDEALSYALRAGKYFDINGPQNDFTEILIHKAIEKYIQNCREQAPSDEQEQYKKIVDIAIENSIAKADYKCPLGIAIDTQDVSLFKRVSELMNIHKLVESILPQLLSIDISFRKVILDIIVSKLCLTDKYTASQYINILQVLYAKGDYENASRMVY